MGATRGACFHCGLPLPPAARFAVRIADVERAMCCAGCAGIAQTIVDAGLADYYTQRGALPQTPLDALPAALRERADAATAADIPKDGEQEALLLLEGMTCAACAWLIERHLMYMAGVLQAQVNFSAQRMRVRWDAARIDLGAITSAIAQLGYRAQHYQRPLAEAARRREHRRILFDVFLSGLASMQIMMYTIPVYMSNGDMTADIVALMRWAGLMLTLPVVWVAARRFFTGAWRDVRARRLGMDVPVALGVLTAFVPSAWTTFTGAGEVYFDALCMFVFLLLGGRYLEMLARRRAGDALERLMSQAPSRAQRLSAYPADWRTEPVAPADLQPGDFILVKPGETVAADGELVEGESEVDESLLTGEPQPVVKRKGATIIAGAINRLNAMIVRVTQVGEHATLALVTRLIERGLAHKPRVVLSAERAASWFVAGLLLLAVAVFFAWHSVDPAKAVWVTVAVLVVTCPCALSLATPAALAAATNAATRRGILITQSHVLETAAHVNHVVFDKTGTLTHGRMQLTRVRLLSDLTAQECLALAALVESGSEHPVAQAIRAAAPQRTLPHALSDVLATAGAGVQAKVDGLAVRMGSIAFVAALHGKPAPAAEAAPGETLVALGDEAGWLALFSLRDSMRGDAKHAIERLHQLRCGASLLSGDTAAAVRDVAERTGIPDYAAAQSPADKLERVQALQRSNVVGMVGDGINDTPSLAGAALSIAMGAGTDLARSSADVVLLSNRPSDAAYLLELGRRTRRIIRQNLAWAIGYNALAVPFAALGWLTPWMAGLGMALSSLLVVLNALRLNATTRGSPSSEPLMALQSA